MILCDTIRSTDAGPDEATSDDAAEARTRIGARSPAGYELALMKTKHRRGGEPTRLEAIAQSVETREITVEAPGCDAAPAECRAQILDGGAPSASTSPRYGLHA